MLSIDWKLLVIFTSHQYSRNYLNVELPFVTVIITILAYSNKIHSLHTYSKHAFIDTCHSHTRAYNRTHSECSLLLSVVAVVGGGVHVVHVVYVVYVVFISLTFTIRFYGCATFTVSFSYDAKLAYFRSYLNSMAINCSGT